MAQPGRWEQVVVAALLGVTLVLSMSVAQARPAVVRAATAVAVALVIVSVLDAALGQGTGLATRLSNLLLLILAPPAILVGILRTLRARNKVTIEAVFGVLCLYLLLGMFFAGLYATIGRIDGTFFAQSAGPTTARYLYFSFVTLTTVGYGDLTAKSNLGHTLSVSEALIGQIYLVTVVSLIVANLGRSRSSIEEPQRSGSAS